jgi:hypothetical protein
MITLYLYKIKHNNLYNSHVLHKNTYITVTPMINLYYM